MRERSEGRVILPFLTFPHSHSQEFGLKAVAREDIYEALLDVEAAGGKLNAEEQRLLDRMIRDRKRNGLGLPKDKRDELLALQTKIMGLEVDFQRACNEEKGSLLFTKEELEGVPEAVLEGYAKEGDKYKVTFKVGTAGRAGLWVWARLTSLADPRHCSHLVRRLNA